MQTVTYSILIIFLLIDSCSESETNNSNNKNSDSLQIKVAEKINRNNLTLKRCSLILKRGADLVYLDSSSVKGNYYLSIGFSCLGRDKWALKSINKTIMYDDSIKSDYLEIKAMSLSNVGQADSAIKVLDNALKINSDSSFVYYLMADIYMRNYDSFGKAINYFSKALEINESYLYRYQRGIAFLYSGQPKMALDDFDNLSPSDNHNKGHKRKFYYYRGKAFYKINNYPKAIKDLKKSLKVNPGFFKPYKILGEIYCFKGKIKKGCKLLHKAKKKSLEVDSLIKIHCQ